MKPIDYAKALALALGVLALNMLITVAAVFVYAQFIEPGHDRAFYDAAAMRISLWTAPAGGMLLMVIAGYVFGRRRPERNAIMFALALGGAYVLFDTASGLASGPASEFLKPHFVMSMLGAVLAAVTGAVLARRA